MPAKKIKILHLIPTFATGGAEKMVLEYSRLLNPKKFEFYVAGGVADGELRPEFEKNKNIHVLVSSREKHGGRWGAWRVLKKYLWEIRPDIIHTHLVSSDVVGYWTKKRADWNIKWVSTMHNVEYYTPRWRRLVWRLILSRADKVIAVGKKVERATIELFKIKPPRLITIPNGIVLDPWLLVTETKKLNKAINLGIVGRLMAQKGHIILFKALAELKDLDWRLNIFGAGELAESLKHEARTLGIDNKIIWRGVVNDLSQALADIDLIIQPSLWEGLSLAIMEAMAAGRCVIASRAAGEELIEDGDNGFLTPTGDSRALAKVIGELIANPDLIIKAGKRAREKAREKFGIERGIAKLESIYLSLRSAIK